VFVDPFDIADIGLSIAALNILFVFATIKGCYVVLFTITPVVPVPPVIVDYRIALLFVVTFYFLF